MDNTEFKAKIKSGLDLCLKQIEKIEDNEKRNIYLLGFSSFEWYISSRLTRTTGTAKAKINRKTGMMFDYKIGFSIPKMRDANLPTNFFNMVVAHEVAHIIDYHIRSKSGHDVAFRRIAKQLGGSLNSSYNDYEVEKYRQTEKQGSQDDFSKQAQEFNKEFPKAKAIKVSSLSVELSFNIPKNGLELSFNKKPNVETRDFMKGLSFRWHRVKQIWYAKNVRDNLESVKKFFGDSLKTA